VPSPKPQQGGELSKAATSSKSNPNHQQGGEPSRTNGTPAQPRQILQQQLGSGTPQSAGYLSSAVHPQTLQDNSYIASSLDTAVGPTAAAARGTQTREEGEVPPMKQSVTKTKTPLPNDSTNSDSEEEDLSPEEKAICKAISKASKQAERAEKLLEAQAHIVKIVKNYTEALATAKKALEQAKQNLEEANKHPYAGIILEVAQQELTDAEEEYNRTTSALKLAKTKEFSAKLKAAQASRLAATYQAILDNLQTQFNTTKNPIPTNTPNPPEVIKPTNPSNPTNPPSPPKTTTQPTHWEPQGLPYMSHSPLCPSLVSP
jgi:hypothetical protein